MCTRVLGCELAPLCFLAWCTVSLRCEFPSCPLVSSWCHSSPDCMSRRQISADVQIWIFRTRRGNRRRSAFRITRTGRTRCPTCRIKWAATPSSSSTEATRFRLLRTECAQRLQATLASAPSLVNLNLKKMFYDGLYIFKCTITWIPNAAC